MKPIAGLLLATILAGLTPSGIAADNSSVHMEIHQSIARSWELFEKYERVSAIKSLADIVKRHPHDYSAHRAYQTVMINSGRYQEVHKEYQDRIARSPDDPMGYVYAALIAQGPSDTRTLIERGLKVAGSDEWLLAIRSILEAEEMRMRGAYEDALRMLQSTSERALDVNLYWETLVRTQLELGQVVEAQRTAEAALKRHPRQAEIYAINGEALMHGSNYAKAVFVLQQGSRIAESPLLNLYLAQAMYELGWGARAREGYQRVLKLPADNVQPDAAYAEANLALDRFHEAAQWARRVLKREPYYPSMMSILAVLAIREQRHGEAGEWIARILERNPKDVAGILTKGGLAINQGRYPDAAAAFGELANRVPANVGFKRQLGWAQVCAGDVDKGEQNLLEAVQTTPESPGTRFLMAMAAMCREDYGRASTLFHEVLAMDADDKTAVEMSALADCAWGLCERGLASFEALKDKETSREERQRLAERINDIRPRLGKFIPYPKVLPKILSVRFDPGEIAPEFEVAFQTMNTVAVGRPWAGDVRRLLEDPGSNEWFAKLEWTGDARGLYYVSHGTAAARLMRIGAADGAALWTRAFPAEPVGSIPPEMLQTAAAAVGVPVEEAGESVHGSSVVPVLSQLSRSPDGSRLYYQRFTVGKLQLERMPAAGGTGEVLHSIEPCTGYEYYSHNLHANQFFVSLATGTIDVLDARSGKTAGYLADTRLSARGSSISPDGTKMLLILHEPSGDFEIQTIDLRSKKRAFLGIRSMDLPSWSPDGRKFAYRASGGADGSPRLHVYDLASNSVEAVDGVPAHLSEAFDMGVQWSPDSRFIAYHVLGRFEGRDGLGAIHATAIADLQAKRQWLSGSPLQNFRWAPIRTPR